MKILASLMVAGGLMTASFANAAVDADAAQALLKKSDCFKCHAIDKNCLLYTSPSPRDRQKSRMPSSA